MTLGGRDLRQRAETFPARMASIFVEVQALPDGSIGCAPSASLEGGDDAM